LINPSSSWPPWSVHFKKRNWTQKYDEWKLSSSSCFSDVENLKMNGTVVVRRQHGGGLPARMVHWCGYRRRGLASGWRQQTWRCSAAVGLSGLWGLVGSNCCVRSATASARGGRDIFLLTAVWPEGGSRPAGPDLISGRFGKGISQAPVWKHDSGTMGSLSYRCGCESFSMRKLSVSTPMAAMPEGNVILLVASLWVPSLH
jgi:hypothetical protein